MSANIVVITREFGSGGRTIGKETARALGYDFYDWNLVEKIAAESGFAKSFIEENGEDCSSMPWLFKGSNGGFDLDDQLYAASREVILKIAEKGNCVIVGRCADYILRQRSDVLSCFVFADEQKRMERIEKEYGVTDVPVKKRLREKDRRRKAHYQYHTGRKWGKSFYYDLCLDSGRLSIETCTALIVQAARALDPEAAAGRED